MNLKIELAKARAELKRSKTSNDELEAKVKELEANVDTSNEGYTTEIETLKDENTTLKETVKGLEETNQTLGAEKIEIEKAKDALQTTLNEKEDWIKNLEARVKELEQVPPAQVDSPNGAGNPEGEQVKEVSKPAKDKTTK